MMEGHKGGISQVEFGPQSDTIITSSDDGKVFIWNWKTGTITSSCMRHPSAVRTFDFNYDRPDIVVCGRNDGFVTVWDTKESIRMDEIAPEPIWSQNDFHSGVNDKNKNHCGSIMCVKLSVDKQLLATCSSDYTCKLWKVSSYQKDLLEVKAELKQCDHANEILEGYIDVTDVKFDSQLQFDRIQTLRLGEVPISSGYHTALRFTFQHEAPVLTCAFTINSDIIVTGSLDATCRIWSSRRGEPLFQINMPAPITTIKVDFNDNLYFGCINRLLTFKLRPTFKEQDLPFYWQNAEIKKLVEQNGSQKGGHQVPMVAKKIQNQTIALSELKRLIAHGALLPDSLDDIVSQYPGINKNQLIQNMKKFQVGTHQVLRLIANTPFSPTDILHALSNKVSPQKIYSLIKQGASIATFMVKSGYKMLRTDEDPMITLDLRSLVHPSNVVNRNRITKDFDYINWWKRFFPLESEEEENDEFDEDGEDGVVGNFSNGRQYTKPKGKLIHFIPSEQMKIIKDYQLKREIKPIFLLSLAKTGDQFPNFNADDEYEEILMRSRKPVPTKSKRFNESLKTKMVRTKYKPGLKSLQDGIEFNNEMPSKRKSVYESSQMFQTEKYFQTRGLNISFENHGEADPQKKRADDLQIRDFTETLLSTPIVLRQNKVNLM
jgi:hypothetical protein